MRTGRPHRRIDFKRFEALLAVGSTLRTVARRLKISEDTAERICRRRYNLNFRQARRKIRSEFLDRALSLPRQPNPTVEPAKLGKYTSLPNFSRMTAEEMEELSGVMLGGARVSGIRPQRSRSAP